MKILAVGDMHLGRSPSRLPPELRHRAGERGPAEGWKRTVDAALALGVNAVLLAGDVVEDENDFFEAYRELAGGVKRLQASDIAVIGVAGNHDVKVLPRLAQELPHFKLLGAAGEWERCAIGSEREPVTLWGWSFPRAKVGQSPLPSRPFARGEGLNLGLLHCDRDAGQSDYAPVKSQELERAGLDGWLLGHIHKPDDLAAPSPKGYLGSLTGLSRRESGPRGPWLIAIDRGAIAEVRQLPLAPLRWQRLEVDLTDAAEPADAGHRLLERLRAFDAQLAAQDYRPQAVALDLRFTGRTRFGHRIAAEFSDEDRAALYSGTEGRHYFIESMHIDTRPEIDLQELAKQANPPGLLAQRLLWLQEGAGHPERDRLIAQASKALRAEAKQPVWGRLDPNDPDPVEYLTRAGYQALDRLLAQDEAQA